MDKWSFAVALEAMHLPAMKTFCWAFSFLGFGFSACLGGFVTGQNADFVLGQPNFTSNTPSLLPTGAFNPSGIAIDPISHKVFVSESGANAVYRYGSADALASGSPAEAILGQPAFGVNSPSTTQSTMRGPTSLAFDSTGRLWVSDSGNNRVLRFDHAASKASGANADGVLGQIDFTSTDYGIYDTATPAIFQTPYGLTVDSSGNLWVADHDNSRVVRFDAADLTTNGAPAKLFLGQMGGTGHQAWESQPTPTRIYEPHDVYAASNGDIYVADSGYYRILRFAGGVNLPDGAIAPSATAEIGAPDFYSMLDTSVNGIGFNAYNLSMDTEGTLYATDGADCRVAGFPNAASIAGDNPAPLALGQATLHDNWPIDPPTVASLYSPVAVTVDYAGRLWVADFHDNRIVRYSSGVLPTFTVHGKPRIKTSSSHFLLKGRLSGAAGSTVYVKVGKGGKFRRAKGHSKWTFNVPLKIGPNQIKIYVMDAAGRKSLTKTLVIIRN